MKTGTKIIAALLLMLYSTTSGAQATKRNYDVNEITLPNFLQYDSTGIGKQVIKGAMDNNFVIISWNTKAEINTSHFELQRSENGKDFDPIETITAGGISKKFSSYATTDYKYGSAKGILYYRIKTVFINGVENFTEAVPVTIKMSSIAKTGTLPPSKPALNGLAL